MQRITHYSTMNIHVFVFTIEITLVGRASSLHTITYFQNIKFIMAVIGQMLDAAIQLTFRPVWVCMCNLRSHWTVHSVHSFLNFQCIRESGQLVWLEDNDAMKNKNELEMKKRYNKKSNTNSSRTLSFAETAFWSAPNGNNNAL